MLTLWEIGDIGVEIECCFIFLDRNWMLRNERIKYSRGYSVDFINLKDPINDYKNNINKHDTGCIRHIVEVMGKYNAEYFVKMSDAYSISRLYNGNLIDYEYSYNKYALRNIKTSYDIQPLEHTNGIRPPISLSGLIQNTGQEKVLGNTSTTIDQDNNQEKKMNQ